MLGALGCGRWLVQLVIDVLESSSEPPYEYLVAQATDNSIPFYERMGFVRVGAVTVTRRKKERVAEVEAEEEEEWKPKGKASAKKRKAEKPPTKASWVASPHSTHRTDGVLSRGGGRPQHEGVSGSDMRRIGADETVAQIAVRLGVPLFDLIFLNRAKLPRLSGEDRLKRDTRLLVPAPVDVQAFAHSPSVTCASHHAHTFSSDPAPFRWFCYFRCRRCEQVLPPCETSGTPWRRT